MKRTRLECGCVKYVDRAGIERWESMCDPHEAEHQAIHERWNREKRERELAEEANRV